MQPVILETCHGRPKKNQGKTCKEKGELCSSHGGWDKKAIQEIYGNRLLIFQIWGTASSSDQTAAKLLESKLKTGGI